MARFTPHGGVNALSLSVVYPSSWINEYLILREAWCGRHAGAGTLYNYAALRGGSFIEAKSASGGLSTSPPQVL
jgi:hypothetical protein